jgi:hypothetical protein
VARSVAVGAGVGVGDGIWHMYMRSRVRSRQPTTSHVSHVSALSGTCTSEPGGISRISILPSKTFWFVRTFTG